MTNTTALPPAGWYPDPDDDAEWRYWDGAQWSDQRSPRTPQPTATSPATAPTAGFPVAGTAAARRSPRSPWMIVLAIVAGLALIGGVAWWAGDSGSSSSDSTSADSDRQDGVDDGDDDVGGDDADVVDGVEAIAAACEDFAGTYGYGPAVDDVQPDGAVAEFVDSWPTNPYTGEPMTQSDAAGDYSFSTATAMPDDSYLGYVTANLGDGTTYGAEFEY